MSTPDPKSRDAYRMAALGIDAKTTDRECPNCGSAWTLQMALRGGALRCFACDHEEADEQGRDGKLGGECE